MALHRNILKTELFSGKKSAVQTRSTVVPGFGTKIRKGSNSTDTSITEHETIFKRSHHEISQVRAYDPSVAAALGFSLSAFANNTTQTIKQVDAMSPPPLPISSCRPTMASTTKGPRPTHQDVGSLRLRLTP